MTGREAVHTDPAWRERADFIIGARLGHQSPSPTAVVSEQLWAMAMPDRRFRICCVPFYVYDLALGDVVEVDDEYNLLRVVEPSGRYVFRVSVPAGGDSFESLAQALRAEGALCEAYTATLFSVDAPDQGTARRISGWLADMERVGRLEYETGKT